MAAWKASIAALARETLARYLNIDAPRLGAALAYYAVLSMAPLLVITIAVAGMAFGREAAQGQVVWQFQQLVGVKGAKAVEALLASAEKPFSGIVATILGIAVLLFGASGVFVELRDSLNYVWGVRTPDRSFRGLVMSRLYSFAMVLAIGFLLLISLLFSAAVAAVGKSLGGYLPMRESELHLLSTLISLVVFTTLFALLYKVIPDLRVRWGDVWLGAAVTSVLFGIGKLLIGLYLGKAGIGSAYGAAGSLVVFLAWVYYSAQVFFLGAVFTHIFAVHRGTAPRRDELCAA